MKLSREGLQVGTISLPRLAWLVVLVAMCWQLLYITSNPPKRDYIIDSDGAGYYAYLPALFIYHDMTFRFCQDGQPTKINFPQANAGMFMNRTSDGKLINKYFIGTAVLEMPFFLVAYGVAPLFGYHMNGYSFPFQLAIALAAIFYVLLGLDQMRKLLAKKELPDYIQAIVILLIFFGTNLYHYALDEPSMSHAYSFGMVALFVNQADNIVRGKNRWSVWWCIMALALIILIRPVNGIFLFAVPFIAGSWSNLKNGFAFMFRNKVMMFSGGAFFALLIFFQLLVYKMGVGSWFADSYSGEHFDLLNPSPMKVLFSWRKGWFVYTPLMLLAVAGIIFLRNNFERLAFIAWLCIHIWFIASWQSWEYGGCFGMRPLVETYAVMSIPLAFFITGTFRKWWTVLSATVLSCLLVVNLIQLYQYNLSILPYDEMTCDRYWKIFLKTDAAWRFIYDPGTIRSHTIPAEAKKVNSFTRTFENDTQDQTVSFWAISPEKPFEGKFGVKLDTGQTTAGICVQLKDAIPDSALWSRTWIRIKSKVFIPEYSLHPFMGVSFRAGGKEYGWSGQRLVQNVSELNMWQDYVYDVKVPLPDGPDPQICIFLVHDDKSIAYADNMELEFWVEP